MPEFNARIGPCLNLHRHGSFSAVSNYGAYSECHKKQSLAQTGTVHAISYSNIGVPPYSPHTPTQRGGARNLASNTTDALSVPHVGKLIAATAFASRIGLPFNRFITIHWEAAGVPPNGIVKATGRYVDLLRKYLNRHGYKTALIWVQEGGHGKGGHVHILAHVPACMVKHITGLNRDWLRRISGRPYVKRVIKSRSIGGKLNIENSNPATHRSNLQGTLEYVLKGANAKAVKQFGLTRQEAGGVCIGKRCGMSQNIGPKAQSLNQAKERI
jgi:hypothetical protein